MHNPHDCVGKKSELCFKLNDLPFSPIVFFHCLFVVSLPSISDSCLWVAVLQGKVMGVVAAVSQQMPGGAVELQWTSIERSSWMSGVGVVLA